MKFIAIVPAILLISVQCTRIREENYRRAHEKWRQERIDGLKSESGWLNLAGLFWLAEGENTFGSDSSNRIVFPPKAPPFMGKYILNGDSIRYVPEAGAGIRYDGYAAGEMEISTDRSGQATILESGSLAWFIIERGDRFAIRLRDFEHPALKEFQGIESFPLKPEWNLQARFSPFDKPKNVRIPTVTGTDEQYLSPGILLFEIAGAKQELHPVQADKRLFIIFADETSGHETYGGGRFLYADPPGKDSTVRIDFNRAYNPPCAFTPFATCPLPPRENILTVRVEAGEKFGGHGTNSDR